MYFKNKHVSTLGQRRTNQDTVQFLIVLIWRRWADINQLEFEILKIGPHF